MKKIVQKDVEARLDRPDDSQDRNNNLLMKEPVVPRLIIYPK